jgi:hypothetical protein
VRAHDTRAALALTLSIGLVVAFVVVLLKDTESEVALLLAGGLLSATGAVVAFFFAPERRDGQ